MRRCNSEAAAGFLRKADLVRHLVSQKSEDQPVEAAVDFAPEFRVQREQEVGANQVLSWLLRAGGQTYSPADAPKAVRWTAGEPVQLRLQFAKDAPTRPLIPQGSEWKVVEDRTVQLEYRGVWALFDLLRNFRVSSESQAAGTYLLQLELPLARNESAPQLMGPAIQGPFRTFLQLKLMQPGGKAPLVLQNLPGNAPPYPSCT